MIACSDGNNHRTWLVFAIFLGIFMSPYSMAAPAPSVGISAGLETFHLRELDNSGIRLVSETGPRYVATVFLDNGDKYQFETPLLYHLEASAYGGQLDYDGKSQSSIDPNQSNIPLRSQTDYWGGRGEAMVGYRHKLSTHPTAIELLGGVGIDRWVRSIHNAIAANGTLVSGIEETYTAYYGKAALGLSDLFPSSWHNHLQFGIKMPFNISEDVGLRNVGYDNDLTLSPGNAYSGFVNILLEPHAKDKKSGNLVISIYYDSFRFDPSKAKSATRGTSSDQVWQPETHIDIFGAQIGYRF